MLVGNIGQVVSVLIYAFSYIIATNTDGTAQHSVRVSRVGRFRATKQHRDVEEGEQQHQQRIVGQVVYWVGFRAPIDRFLR